MSASRTAKAAGVVGGVKGVSEAVKISRPTLNAWFTNKPELFSACVDYSLKQRRVRAASELESKALANLPVGYVVSTDYTGDVIFLTIRRPDGTKTSQTFPFDWYKTSLDAVVVWCEVSA